MTEEKGKTTSNKFVFETTPERSKRMSGIKSTNTKPEILLRKTLWSKNIRYRLNLKTLFGTPDIVVKKAKLVIFVDGEFWHGYDWEVKREKIKANSDYWIPKIERNIARDLEVNEHLTKAGWTVLRFWSNEIKKNLPEVIATIEDHINKNQKPDVNYLQQYSELNIAAEPSHNSSTGSG